MEVETKNVAKLIGITLIAGSLTGAVECCITYPLEYLKTVMQLYPKMALKGMKYTFLNTVKKFGSFGVYRGITTLLAFTIPKVGVRFGAKEISNEFLFGTGSMLRSLCGGIFAGITEGLLVRVVMDNVKVKLIHDRLTKNKYKGLIDGMKKIIKEKGFWGIYTGVGPTILKFSLNQGIRFMVYDTISEKIKEMDFSKHLKRFSSGAIAGGMSVMVNQPIDVIKTNIQGLNAKEYKNSMDCAFKILKQEGFKGFYKGTLPRLIKVIYSTGVNFALIESIRDFLFKMFPNKDKIAQR